jgi:hypothetical protein
LWRICKEGWLGWGVDCSLKFFYTDTLVVRVVLLLLLLLVVVVVVVVAVVVEVVAVVVVHVVTRKDVSILV